MVQLCRCFGSRSPSGRDLSLARPGHGTVAPLEAARIEMGVTGRRPQLPLASRMGPPLLRRGRKADPGSRTCGRVARLGSRLPSLGRFRFRFLTPLRRPPAFAFCERRDHRDPERDCRRRPDHRDGRDACHFRPHHGWTLGDHVQSRKYSQPSIRRDGVALDCVCCCQSLGASHGQQVGRPPRADATPGPVTSGGEWS